MDTDASTRDSDSLAESASPLPSDYELHRWLSRASQYPPSPQLPRAPSLHSSYTESLQQVSEGRAMHILPESALSPATLRRASVQPQTAEVMTHSTDIDMITASGSTVSATTDSSPRKGVNRLFGDEMALTEDQ